MNIYAVSALSASLIIALIGLYVFYKNPSQKVNRLYLISNFVIALWLFGCFGESNIIKNTAYLLLWDKFLNIFAVFSPAVFVHVIFTIIDSHEQRYLRLNYLISILLALSVFSPFYSLGVRAYYGVRSITIPGPLYYIFILFLCWCGYLSITRTLSAIRRAERGGGESI